MLTVAVVVGTGLGADAGVFIFGTVTVGSVDDGEACLSLNFGTATVGAATEDGFGDMLLAGLGAIRA